MKQKIVIYSVLSRLFDNRSIQREHNGSISRNGSSKMNGFSYKALKAIRELGATHIWYIGLIDHACTSDYRQQRIAIDNAHIVKGKAGSPYAIKDYYDVCPDLATHVEERMHEFDQLVKRTHLAGLKMIIDFVPNHVARGYRSDAKPPFVKDLGYNDNKSKAFDPQNNFYYLPGVPLEIRSNEQSLELMPYSEFPARATGNDCFSPTPATTDWYETVKLNYGVDYQDGMKTYFDPIPDTWHKMLEILIFWTNKGVDGFRCDMAEMVPVEFWQWAIPQVKKVKPVTFIAEIYRPEIYETYLIQGQFDYLYDKVGMYDTLREIVSKQKAASEIEQRRLETISIQERMLYFLENHDEQRIASDFFAGSPEKAVAAVTVAATLSSNPFMIYFAQELGERGMDCEGFSGVDGRTSIFDYWSLDKMQRWIGDSQYDADRLTDDEKHLRNYYQQLLAKVCSHRLVSMGKYQDLSRGSSGNNGFNPSSHFAFARYDKGELLLVVANFSSTKTKLGISFAHDVLKNMQIPNNTSFKVNDMLKESKAEIACLNSYASYWVSVAAHSATILHLEELL